MGALDNVRVIDFGHYVAGPVTGMLLADQGAEVIKVDPPGGPVFRSPANRTWNRGKKSICLDLKSPEDVAVARSLILEADVVIENFRPGVMSGFGLDADALRRENPGLIYASLPGFAPEDPRSGRPCWEGVVLAATDTFRPLADYRDMVQMLHRPLDRRQGTPAFTPEPVASMYAAFIASLCIATALHARAATGRGQRVQVPLFDAMLQAVGILALARLPFRPITRPIFSGFDHQYRCADGRWVHIVCTVPGHARRFLEAIHREDLIEAGMAEPGLAARPELNDRLTAVLTETFLTRTAGQWENLFVELGIPGSACHTTREWLAHPQATDSDLLLSLEDPELGTLIQPGLQVKLSETSGGVRGPAPLPDQHRREILAGLAASPSGAPRRPEGPAGEPSGFPLAGIRVLDLCIILAGPTCGRTLAELGAEVIKIDDPGRGDVVYHHDINRGKRSLLLDLKTPEGLDVFWDLVAGADVIVQNYRSGVVERLGIDYETVRRRKPDIVYVSLNAFGDTGPWERQPGYEEVAQALTGMQVRFGGEDRPILWPYGVINDYGTGFAGAYGAVLALLERQRTGRGQHVTSALARTACTLQSAWMQDYRGKVWDEPQGPGCLGFSPIQRLYECRDGWLYLGAKRPADVAAVLGVAEDGELESRIARWCRERPVDDAVRALNSDGCAAQELVWINDLASEAAVAARGLVVTREHGALGLMRTTGPAPWFSGSAVHAGSPAGVPGEDAPAVLAGAGRDDLAGLVEAGAIRLPERRGERGGTA